MTRLATLRSPLDAFFVAVIVNDDRDNVRQNRLRLLAKLRAAMNNAADFARIDA